MFRYKSKYKKVSVLPIWIVKSNVSSIGPSSERKKRRVNARNVRLYYPYWQYTDLFIFRFASLLCLPSTLRLMPSLLLSVNYIHPMIMVRKIVEFACEASNEL